MKKDIKTPIQIRDWLSTRVQDIAKLVSAIIVIGGAVIWCGNWIVSNVTADVSSQLVEMSKNHASDIKSLTESAIRTELQLLIIHNPEDKVAIEMMAKEYFLELKANHYMKSFYSRWAAEYGGDTSFLVNTN